MEILGMNGATVSLSRSSFCQAKRSRPMLFSVSCKKDGDRTAKDDGGDSLKFFKNTIFIPIGPINLMSVQSSKKHGSVPKVDSSVISPNDSSDMCDDSRISPTVEQEDWL